MILIFRLFLLHIVSSVKVEGNVGICCKTGPHLSVILLRGHIRTDKIIGSTAAMSLEGEATTTALEKMFGSRLHTIRPSHSLILHFAPTHWVLLPLDLQQASLGSLAFEVGCRTIDAKGISPHGVTERGLHHIIKDNESRAASSSTTPAFLSTSCHGSPGTVPVSHTTFTV
ncbi:uncharacterized protein LOC124850945 isoform X2 [Scophthalmus maximus]|uniref:uncharacterized protein LOC124850945 isoform X2 n=1 Tax=Scophthalmus maximus TaxID=52904 RepID=UPI001FA8C6DD|nr:uncharacterized protein LOC124850945 isoform X2 [Scophthalmus maximus]